MTSRRERQKLLAFIKTLPKTMTEVDIDLPRAPEHIVMAWRSRYFTAQLFDEPNGLRLSIQRTTESIQLYLPGKQRPISWDELMKVKQEVGMGDRWAVEILPPHDQVVNIAPMRHIWILDGEPDYGWRAGVNERQS